MRSQNEHECQKRGIDLQEGDEVLVNDRSRSLLVVGRHARQQQTSTWKRRGEGKYHTVIELEGNGTKYHMICTSGSDIGPMLYKESEWDEDRTNKIGQSPKYARGGERVESIEQE